MSAMVVRSPTRPRLIGWLITSAVCLVAWLTLIALDLLPAIPAVEHSEMSVRLIGYVLPPLMLASALFLGQWLTADARQEEPRTTPLQQAREKLADSEGAREHQLFSLEVRGLGITLDRFRQGKLWNALDETNHLYQTILSQSPEDYEWSARTRSQEYDKREADAFEQALNGWVERWPIPIIVAGPSTLSQPASRIGRARQNGGMAIHLFTVLGQHQGEGTDQLVSQLFDFFDRYPEIPAAVVLSSDSHTRRPEFANDAHFIPSLPDSIVALLVTRSDRVDRDIRPFTTIVPYEINLDDTQYDVIQLWNDYWGAHEVYRDRPKNHSFMPWDEWHTAVQPLIARIDPNGSQGRLLARWSGKTGFKPSPWVPVRWTDWQMKEYDSAPLLGYLHRPVEVALDTANNPKAEAANGAAMAEAWGKALDTLPQGVAPVRLFYDTAGEGRRVIPLARAFALDETPAPLAIDDAAASYDLSRRIGDTGVSSPFVNLALALMRSYHQGGASATVNLREASRASVIMVSPPTPEQKARNPRQPNPFKNPDGPAY